jgi:hypothetical protein
MRKLTGPEILLKPTLIVLQNLAQLAFIDPWVNESTFQQFLFFAT